MLISVDIQTVAELKFTAPLIAFSLSELNALRNYNLIAEKLHAAGTIQYIFDNLLKDTHRVWVSPAYLLPVCTTCNFESMRKQEVRDAHGHRGAVSCPASWLGPAIAPPEPVSPSPGTLCGRMAAPGEPNKHLREESLYSGLYCSHDLSIQLFCRCI